MLIPCGVGTEIYLRNSRGKHSKTIDKYPELFISGRDIAVTEFGVDNHLLFRPPGSKRLIGFVSIVAEEGILFLCCSQGSILIKGSLCAGGVFLY